MRLILVTIFVIQLHGCVNGAPNPSQKYIVPPGIYELRPIGNDEIGSIKPDRIVTIPHDQPLLRSLEAWQQSGGLPMPTPGDRRDYAHHIREDHSPRRPQETQKISSTDNEESRRKYIQAQILKGYQLQQILQAIPQNSGKTDYVPKQQKASVSNAVQTEQRPQVMTQNYHVVNGEGRQDYMQAPQNYQVVNDNSQFGGISISLPEYRDASEQDYQLQGVPENYQVVNEGPTAHVVSVPGAGNPSSILFPPHWPQNENSQTQVISSPDNAGQHYPQFQNEPNMPFESSYIPQQQQPEVQYSLRQPQQTPTQMPLALKSNGTEQLLDLIRKGQMVPPIWPAKAQ